MTATHEQPWHWPHLALLATLPPWWWLTRGWPDTLSLIVWLALNVLVLAVAEQCCGARDDWNATRPDLRRDAWLWSFNAVSDGLATALAAALAMAFTSDRLAAPIAVQIVGGIYLAEFGSYWLHRVSHGDNWIWRLHLLHHRPGKLNVANSLTAHPLNAFYDKLVRLTPLLLLGFQREALLAVALFQMTQALATHANVRGRMGWLNHVIGSAELHRLHHSTDPAEAGNFGTAVPLWDQLFGTYRSGREPRQVGVFDAGGYPTEHQWGALLRWPWSRRAAS